MGEEVTTRMEHPGEKSSWCTLHLVYFGPYYFICFGAYIVIQWLKASYKIMYALQQLQVPVNIWAGIDTALITWKENTEDYSRDKFQF